MEGTSGLFSYPSVESVAASDSISHQQDVAEAGNNPFRSIFREIAIWQEALEEKTAEANVAYDVRNQGIRKIFYSLQKRLTEQKKQLQQKQMELMSILTSKDPLNQQWSIADAMRGDDPALLDPLHLCTSRLPGLFGNMFPTKSSVHDLFGTVKLSTPPERDDGEVIEMRKPYKHDNIKDKAMKEVMFAIRSALFYEAKCYTLMSQSTALNQQYFSCKGALNGRVNGLHDVEDWEEEEEQKDAELKDGSGGMYIINPAENPHLGGAQQSPGPPHNVLDELARMYMSKQKPMVVISMECVDLKIDYASLLADKERHLMQWIKYYRMARNLMLSMLINTITAEIDALIRSLYQNKHSSRLEFEVGSVQAHRDLLRELIDAQLREWQTAVNALIKTAADNFMALSDAKIALVEALWPDPSLPDYAGYLMDYKAPVSRYGKFKSVILENECQLMADENARVNPSENQRLAARIVLQPNRTKEDGKALVDFFRGECLDWDMGSGKSITIALAILRLLAKYINYLKLHPRPPNTVKATTFPLHALILVHQGSAITPLIKEIYKAIRSIEPYKQWYLEDDDISGLKDKVYFNKYPENTSHYAVLKFKYDFTIMFHSIGRAYELKDTPGINVTDPSDINRHTAAYAAHKSVSPFVTRPSLYAWSTCEKSLYHEAHTRLVERKNKANKLRVEQLEGEVKDGNEVAELVEQNKANVEKRKLLFKALQTQYEHAIETAITTCLRRDRGNRKFVLPFDDHLPHDGTFPLIVVQDEIHTALSTHSNMFHKESMISLGWCNAVQKQPDLRILLSSGTILPNPKYPIDVIKLLSMIQPTIRLTQLQKAHLPFWRPNLIKSKWHDVSDVKVDGSSVSLKELHDYIDELEHEHMVHTYNRHPGYWKTEGKENFQNDHTGLISYITMQYDKNKFPTIVDTCPGFLGTHIPQDSIPPQVQRLEGKRIVMKVVGIDSPRSASETSVVNFANAPTNVVYEIIPKDFQLMRNNEIPGSSFLSRMIPVYVPLNRGARTNYLREYNKSVRDLLSRSKHAPSDMELAQNPESTISLDRFNTLVPGAMRVGNIQKKVADEFATKVVTMRDIIKRLPDCKHFIGYPPKRGNGTLVEQFLSNKLTSQMDVLKIRYRKLAVKDMEDFLLNDGDTQVKSTNGENVNVRTLDAAAKMSLFVRGFIQFAKSTLTEKERFIVVTENLNRKKEGGIYTVFARLSALKTAVKNRNEVQSGPVAPGNEDDLSTLYVIRGLPQKYGTDKRVVVKPNTLPLRNGDTVKLVDPDSVHNPKNILLECFRQPYYMDDMTKEQEAEENKEIKGNVQRRYLSPLMLYLASNLPQQPNFQTSVGRILKNGDALILKTKKVPSVPSSWEFVLLNDPSTSVILNPKYAVVPPPDYREDVPNEATHMFNMTPLSDKDRATLDAIKNLNDQSRLLIPDNLVNAGTRLAFIEDDNMNDELARYRVVSKLPNDYEDGEIVEGLYLKAYVDEILIPDNRRVRNVPDVEDTESAASDIVRSPQGASFDKNIFGVASDERNSSQNELNEENQLYDKILRKRMDAMTAQLSDQRISAKSSQQQSSSASSSSSSVSQPGLPQNIPKSGNTYNDLFDGFPSFGLDELRHLYLNFFTQSSEEVAHIFMGNYQDVLGLSVINTVYGHIAELPSNLSVFAQTIFRIARFCGLPHLSDPTKWKIRFFVYLSTLGFDNGVSQVKKTSEEVMWEQYQLAQDLGANMLRSLAEKALDCPLMQDYNSDPNNPIQCAVNVGQAEFQSITRPLSYEKKMSETIYTFQIYKDAKPLLINTKNEKEIVIDKHIWDLIISLSQDDGDIKWKVNKSATACRFPAKLYYGLIDHWLLKDEIGIRHIAVAKSALSSARNMDENDMRILVAYLSQDFDEFKAIVLSASSPLHPFVFNVITTLQASTLKKEEPIVTTWMNQLLAAKQNHTSMRGKHEISKKELAQKIETIPGVDAKTGEKWIYLNPTTKRKVTSQSSMFQQLPEAHTPKTNLVQQQQQQQAQAQGQQAAAAAAAGVKRKKID